MNKTLSDLIITWQTLVTYRDIALEHQDWERAVLYSNVIGDIAFMIEKAGGQVPRAD